MSAADFLPGAKDLRRLREASMSCRGCGLYRAATQTVFGAGNPHARVMLIGEEPGDKEDRAGEPFVGPAGRLLGKALDEAGVDPQVVYLTNVVKHFKWERRGSVRLHKRPSAGEVQACLPWLSAEIDAIDPEVLVCLGATAAHALLGRGFRLTERRGTVVEGADGHPAIATVHPSSVLRAPDSAQRAAARQGLVEDLRAIHQVVRAGRGTRARGGRAS